MGHGSEEGRRKEKCMLTNTPLILCVNASSDQTIPVIEKQPARILGTLARAANAQSSRKSEGSQRKKACRLIRGWLTFVALSVGRSQRERASKIYFPDNNSCRRRRRRRRKRKRRRNLCSLDLLHVVATQFGEACYQLRERSSALAGMASRS